jgi:molecular chaperone IbpA
MFSLLDNAARMQGTDNWPPYDIIKTGDDEYMITMAVAGFSPDELTITHEPNLLVVAGQKSGDDNGQYLHRGLTARSFERRFELADHVQVEAASLVNGLLTIELKREIPEAMKPHRIEISNGQNTATTTDARQIEAENKVA